MSEKRVSIRVAASKRTEDRMNLEAGRKSEENAEYDQDASRR